MTSHRQNWFEGWRLFAVLTLTLAGALRLDRLDAAVRGRRRAHGDPLHRADLAVVLLPRLLRRGAGAAVAQRLDAMAAPQPPLSRRDLRGLARPPRHRDRLFCRDGPGRLCGRDLGGLLHLRRHRLCLHHRDGRDLVRPHGAGDRPARLAHAAPHRRLLSAVSVHGVVRQADSRHAALRAVPDPAGGRVRAADDQHGAGERRARCRRDSG